MADHHDRDIASESLLEDVNAALLTILPATRTNEPVYTLVTVILEIGKPTTQCHTHGSGNAWHYKMSTEL